MVTINELRPVINRRVSNILTVAEAALPPSQYEAYRRVVLNEFGWSGLASDMVALEKARPGTERKGPE